MSETRQQIETTADEALSALLEELKLYPAHSAASGRPRSSS